MYRHFYWARRYIAFGAFVGFLALLDFIVTSTSYDVVTVESTRVTSVGGGGRYSGPRVRIQLVRVRLGEDTIMVQVRLRRNFVDVNTQACLRTDSPGIWGSTEYAIVDLSFCARL